MAVVTTFRAQEEATATLGDDGLGDDDPPTRVRAPSMKSPIDLNQISIFFDDEEEEQMKESMTWFRRCSVGWILDRP